MLFQILVYHFICNIFLYSNNHNQLPRNDAPSNASSTLETLFEVSEKTDANELAILEATKMIEKTKMPLLLIGAGSNRQRTSDALTQFVESTGIPFFNTQMGKGVLDERHPKFFGTAALSSDDFLHCAINRADLIINVGYEALETAMDYDEALERLHEDTPDLILIDINLGGKKDGIDLATEINEKFSIPFIFTTSYCDGPTILRANAVNPVNYLVKPFKREQLFTAIEMALLKIAGEKKQDEEKAETEGLIIKDAQRV
jgi:CheY-like chemotaxis protein